MRSNNKADSVVELFGRSIVYDRTRLLYFLLSAVAAVYFGFVAFDPDFFQYSIRHAGYYFITGVFVLFVYYSYRVWRETMAGRRGEDWWLWSWLVLMGLAIWGGDRVAHKVLFDEYVIQSTAMNMHLSKEVFCAARSHWLNGSFMPLDGYLDKRPYFLAYLVSIVHDITGYRVTNVFYFNLALLPVFLNFSSRIALNFGGRVAAFATLGLLGTLPLLAQSALSGGLEMLNLTMLAVLLHAAVLYLSEQTNARLGYLCLSGVLASQCRYESLFYLGPVGLVIICAWVRAKRVQLSNVFLVLPLILVPGVWHSRYLSASPVLWELKEGQVSRFSSDFLQGNLAGFYNFYFKPQLMLPNSLFLSYVGFLALCSLIWLAANKIRKREAVRWEWVALVSFALGVAGVTVLFLFYYWARMDDVMACRFSLTLHLILALGAGLSLAIFSVKRRWLLYVFWGLWVGQVMMYYLPASTNRGFTVTNGVAAEVEWQLRYVNSLPQKPRLVVGYNSLPWVVNQYSAINWVCARRRQEDVGYHVREGTFKEVLVVQQLSPTSAEGDFAVLVDQVAPPEWKLETVAMKRFGGRLIRISRVLF